MNTMESDEQQDFERKSETRGFKPLKRKSNYVKKSELIEELNARIASADRIEAAELANEDPIGVAIIRYRRTAFKEILDFINSK